MKRLRVRLRVMCGPRGDVASGNGPRGQLPAKCSKVRAGTAIAGGWITRHERVPGNKCIGPTTELCVAPDCYRGYTVLRDELRIWSGSRHGVTLVMRES